MNGKLSPSRKSYNFCIKKLIFFFFSSKEKSLDYSQMVFNTISDSIQTYLIVNDGYFQPYIDHNEVRPLFFLKLLHVYFSETL